MCSRSGGSLGSTWGRGTVPSHMLTKSAGFSRGTRREKQGVFKMQEGVTVTLGWGTDAPATAALGVLRQEQLKGHTSQGERFCSVEDTSEQRAPWGTRPPGAQEGSVASTAKGALHQEAERSHPAGSGHQKGRGHSKERPPWPVRHKRVYYH